MDESIQSMEEIKPRPRFVMPLIAVVILLLVGVLFATVVIPAFQEISRVEETTVKESSISIEPTMSTLKSGEDAKLTINLKSKEDVAAVEVHLSFDPNVISIGEIEPLEFLENPKILAETIDNKNGKLVLIIGGLPARSGEGKLVELTITGAALGKTKLEFDAGTRVSAIGKDQDVLGKNTGAEIEVK